jgi:hypothetical protein
MRIRHIAATSALGVAALGVAFGAMSIPAGADPAGVSGISTGVVAGPSAATTIPTSKIESGTPRTFHPTSLSAAPVTSGCSSTHASLIIENLSTARATVTFGASHTPVFALLPKYEGWLCLTGTAGAKGVFHLEGSTSKLTVTLT